MGQSSALCKPTRSDNAGNQTSGPLSFNTHCVLCSEKNNQNLQELLVRRAATPKVEGVWFDDALLRDARIGSAAEDPSLRHRMLQSKRRLFAPHTEVRLQDAYNLGRKLGDGASADVYHATAIQVDAANNKAVLPGVGTRNGAPRNVAVKVFIANGARDNSKVESNVKGHPDFFKVEWEMLAQLEHPHIVRMYECFKEPTAMYICMELCLGGELIEHVKEVSRRRGRGGLHEPDACHMFKQMLYAGSYLHANRIVHRDVKLENFLLVGGPESAGPPVIKLCDFGTAVVLSDKVPRAFGRIGTLSYTAPEVCSDKGATVLADAWSLGVVLYVLLVGAKPFRLKVEEPREETMRRIQNGNYNQARPGWKSLSEDARALVKALITVQEDQRFGTIEALQHSWAQQDAPNITSANLSPHALKLLALATRLDPLQQFVMSLCSRLLSEKNLLQTGVWTTWYNLFFALDTNKDGQLDFGELARGLWAVLGPSARMSSSQLSSVLRALDLNGSGAIEWSEWAAVALLSAGGVALEDELLATALRLLGPEGRIEELETLQMTAPPRATTNDALLSPLGMSSFSRERVQQLRDRFALWVPNQDLDCGDGAPKPMVQSRSQATARAAAASDVCLDDLREVLDSASWFRLGDGAAAAWPDSGASSSTLTPPVRPTPQSMAASPPDNYASLAASPFCSPRNSPRGGMSFLAASPFPSPRGSPRGTLDGPLSMHTAPCRVPKTQMDSAPNSECGSADVSRENSAQPER